MNKNRFLVCCSLLVVSCFACQQNYTPKPHTYYRIDFPEKEYRTYNNSICPFTFEYPVYGTLAHIIQPTPDSCWFNINFPKYRGTIHLTYRKIEGNFDQHFENHWKLIYSKLAQKADDIIQHSYIIPEKNVYGTLFDIKGDAASSVQFFVTDSVKNILRGALYFTVKPNYDSLAPVVAFFREDIDNIMKTTKWK